MKKGLKRKAGEPIGNWIIRTADKTQMNKEQTELLVSVYKESYNEGIAIGQEIERINQVKRNNHERD